MAQRAMRFSVRGFGYAPFLFYYEVKKKNREKQIGNSVSKKNKSVKEIKKRQLQEEIVVENKLEHSCFGLLVAESYPEKREERTEKSTKETKASVRSFRFFWS